MEMEQIRREQEEDMSKRHEKLATLMAMMEISYVPNVMEF